jgi:heavy metal sensor kinase
MRYLPRLRSFRVRIALLSSLLSAAVLLAFALWAWQAVQRTNLRRIDQSIRELGDRHLGMRLPPQYWQYATESLEFVLGNLRDNPFILLVKGRDGNLVHVSSNWPDELPASEFPTPIEAGFSEAPERWAAPMGAPPQGWRNRRSSPEPPQPAPPPQRDDLAPPQRDDLAPPQQDELALPPRADAPPPRHPEGMPPPRPPQSMPIRVLSVFTAHAGGQDWRVGVMSNPEVTLVLGLNLAPYTAEMGRLRRLFLTAVPAALLLVALGGWWLAQRALRPIQELTRTAEGITARGLGQRILLDEEDIEFDRLIRVFNNMLDRLDKSFQQAVRFSADAAHELKTPLTILQGELAQAVQGAEPGSEQQQVLGRLLEEVQRIKSITRKLLLLSLADSGQLKPNLEPLDLTALLEEAVEDTEILMPGLTVEHRIDSGVWIAADGDLIRQVIQNLKSNAIKYNQPNGFIRFSLRRENGTVLLTVANTGPGIPAEDRGKVFERFYRADKARNRNVDGMGLGLSLSREIARAHAGDLVLEETYDETTAFTLTLPEGAPPAGNSTAV